MIIHVIIQSSRRFRVGVLENLTFSAILFMIYDTVEILLAHTFFSLSFESPTMITKFTLYLDLQN